MRCLRLAALPQKLKQKQKAWLVECMHPTHRKLRDGWGTREFVAGRRRTDNGNRRSFDCASRDKTARGSAQDDKCCFLVLFRLLWRLEWGLRAGWWIRRRWPGG